MSDCRSDVCSSDLRLMVLLRRFECPRTFTIKLLRVDSRRIAPGAMVDGTEIATFAPPYIHDNFEAVAATREGGATIAWNASGDNKSILPRSLLLKFRLIEPDPPGRPATSGITIGAAPSRERVLQHGEICEDAVQLTKKN